MAFSYSLLESVSNIIHWDDYSDKYPGISVWGYIKETITVGTNDINDEGIYFLEFEYRFRVLTRQNFDIDNLDSEGIVFSCIGILKFVIEQEPVLTTIEQLQEIESHAYKIFVANFNSRKSGNLSVINVPLLKDLHGQLDQVYKQLHSRKKQ